MKQDTATKEYFSNNVRFADIVNYYLFEGRKVIKEDQLRSIDTNYASSGVQRIRDIVMEVAYDMAMKTDGVMNYIIVGIENQSQIDYGMVVRTLLYDALAYDRQMKEIKQGRRSEKNYYGYLRETDRLNPVITIVIYYGEEKWDGKKSLRDLVKCPVELRKYIPDYELHLLELYQLKEKDLKRFHSEIQKIFLVIQYKNSREKMMELLKDKFFERVDVESIKFLNSMTDLKIEIKGKESINMCKAFMEQKEIGIKEGMILGRAEGLEAGIEKTKKEIVRNLYANNIDIGTIMKVTSLTEEEVQKIVY